MEKRFYKKKEYYFNLGKTLGKKASIISNIRFLMVIFIIYVGFKIEKSNSSFWVILETIAVLSFLGLVIYHLKLKDKVLRSNLLLNINQRYMDRTTDNWMDFEDIGEEFLNDDHNYSSDLDIIGRNSLFQMLNITNTHTGRRLFAKELLNPKRDKGKIYSRQGAISELSDDMDLVQEIEYLTLKKKKDLKDPDKLIAYAESDTTIIKDKLLRVLIRVLPILTISTNILGILTDSAILIYSGMTLAIIQVFIWIFSMFKNNGLLSTVGYLRYNLEIYLEILKLIEKKDFKSDELIHIKREMFSDESSSIIAIKQLDTITQIISLRSGAILNIVLNALFLWDYQCIFLLENWKGKYGNRVADWIEGIGQIESLMSFSVLNNIRDNVVFPEIIDDVPKVIAKDLGHPLINSEKRINNDLCLNDEIFIITGSNMSGKTTFLRTIGVNLVLAYNGAVICGESMQCTLLDIMTSMRIQDDLSAGISTFYAEILRIKKIIDKSENTSDMIFLIDEIFTGTNSPDRIAGAKNVLANLNKKNIIGAITTHDLELCELDKDKRIRNYHFKDTYKDDTITFDYKIKDGKSTSTNAKNLMRIAGIKIIEE